MATNRKPRKPYRPKRNLVNPVAHVLDGMTVLAPKSVTTLLTANHAAMYEIVQGRGTQEHWRTVTGALNMAIALDEQVYCSVEATTLIAALKAQAELDGVAVKRWLRLFNKNTALCQHESGRIRCDACPVLED